MVQRLLTSTEIGKISAILSDLDKVADIVGCNDARQYFPDAVAMLTSMAVNGTSDGATRIDPIAEVRIDDQWAAMWPRRWVMACDCTNEEWRGPYRLFGVCDARCSHRYVTLTHDGITLRWRFCRPATPAEIATVEPPTAPEVEASPVEKAMATLRGAMAADSDYAWTWYCNVTMAALDAGAKPRVADACAVTFMRNAFDVDIRKCEQWRATESSDLPTAVGSRVFNTNPRERQ